MPRSPRPLLRAYIDETGDRGLGGNASPFFAFAAVLIPEEDEPELRAAVSRLRRDLKIPAGKPLHWNQHVKTFPRRQHVTSVLGSVESVRVVYVGVEKAAIPATAGMRSDQAKFYNFAAGMMVERVLLHAKGCDGGPRDAVIRFGHVRGFDHSTTQDYLDLRANRNDPHWVPWRLMHGRRVHFNDQASWDGLQAADQYAGMFSSALRPDQFGNYEPHHLLATRHQLREHNGRCWNYGVKWLGNDGTLTGLPWWPRWNIAGK